MIRFDVKREPIRVGERVQVENRFKVEPFQKFIRRKLIDKIFLYFQLVCPEVLRNITNQLGCATGALQLSGKIFLEAREVARVTKSQRGMPNPIWGRRNPKSWRTRIAYDYPLVASVDTAPVSGADQVRKFAGYKFYQTHSVGGFIEYRRWRSDEPEERGQGIDYNVALKEIIGRNLVPVMQKELENLFRKVAELIRRDLA